MEAVSEPVNCRRCRQPIRDEEDRLEYRGKVYCPLCYGKMVRGGPSKGDIIGWVMGIIVLICVILSWVIYFILSAY